MLFAFVIPLYFYLAFLNRFVFGMSSVATRAITGRLFWVRRLSSSTPSLWPENNPQRRWSALLRRPILIWLEEVRRAQRSGNKEAPRSWWNFDQYFIWQRQHCRVSISTNVVDDMPVCMYMGMSSASRQQQTAQSKSPKPNFVAWKIKLELFNWVGRSGIVKLIGNC